MKVKVYIHAQWQRWDKTFAYSVYNCDMTEYGYTLLEVREIEFSSMDDQRLRYLTAKSLEKAQDKLRADTQKKVMELQEEINSLLAIEDRSSEQEN